MDFWVHYSRLLFEKNLMPIFEFVGNLSEHAIRLAYWKFHLSFFSFESNQMFLKDSKNSFSKLDSKPKNHQCFDFWENSC
jgi:hypothetical protein